MCLHGTLHTYIAESGLSVTYVYSVQLRSTLVDRPTQLICILDSCVNKKMQKQTEGQTANDNTVYIAESGLSVINVHSVHWGLPMNEA